MERLLLGLLRPPGYSIPIGQKYLKSGKNSGVFDGLGRPEGVLETGGFKLARGGLRRRIWSGLRGSLFKLFLTSLGTSKPSSLRTPSHQKG